MKQHKHYVPCLVIEWSKLGIYGGTIGVDDADGSIGFLPVFETIEALRKIYPDEPYMCIEPRKGQVVKRKEKQL